MIPVVIESPYGTRLDGTRASPEEVERNKRYLDAAMAHSFSLGEAPFASHRLYPGVLDDANPAQRRLGMEAGFVWGRLVRVRAFYTDFGMTPGMVAGMQEAAKLNQRVETRTLPAGWVERDAAMQNDHGE